MTESPRNEICFCNAATRSLILMPFVFLLSRLMSPTMARVFNSGGTDAYSA